MAARRIISLSLFCIIGVFFVCLPVYSLPTTDLFMFGTVSGDEHDEFVTNDAPSTVTLSVPIVLYGKKYNTAHVSKTGIVTFDERSGGRFQAQAFPLSYAAIAPYYADIDNEEGGLISARETKKQELLDKANGWIHQYFPDQQSFQAQSLLIATWSEVVGRGLPTNWINTFQLVVANNGEDSFAFFLYPENSLTWSKTLGPDVFAQGGFMSDDGKVTLLEGSGTDYMRGLAGIGKPEGLAPEGVHAYRIGVVEEVPRAATDEETNRWEEPGQYTREPIDTRHPLDPAVLRPAGSEGGAVAGAEPDQEGDRDDDRYEPPTPAPTSGPDLSQKGNPVCADQSECHSSATCQALTGGSCCKCGADLIGNGKLCFDKVKPIQMNGQVSGTLNGAELPPALMHNYVVTEEGRTYVAYSPVPAEIGDSLQTVLPVATIIGWMFALTEGDLQNGFALTGGVANYTATLRFTESGNSVHISQTFSGLGEHSMLQSTMYISGNTPKINPGQVFEYPDHHIDYRRSLPGLIQSFSKGTMKVDEQSHAYTVEESISFQECPFGDNADASKTSRLHVSGIVSLYQAKERASRYSVIAKITPPGSGAADQCGSVDCGPSASCVPGEGEQTQCICRAGFAAQNGADVSAKPLDCIDINECTVRNECSPQAECINTEGSFICRCLSGYTGDGRICRTHEESSLGQEDCNVRPEICGANAQCKPGQQGKGECVCFPGYVGDGRTCALEGSEPVAPPVVAPESCYHNPAQCDRNAACIPDQRSRGQFACQCLQGFEGDGFTCRAKQVSRGGFLAFNQGMSVVQLPLDPNAQDRGGQLAIVPGQTAVGIAVDCANSLLYWSDIAGNTINRARYDGSEVEVVVRNVQSAEGLAIDHVSGNIFWTDSASDHIAVAKLSDLKSGSKVIIGKNLSNPRAIAVHPARGSIYWTDWNRLEPKIETANTDGTERQALVSRDLGLPNALTIDFLTDEICWADAGAQKIECASINGQNRRLIFVGTTYPFGITLHSNTIFWTDWTANTVMSVSKHGGASRSYELPLGSSGKVYGIVAVPEQCPRLQNACAAGNGGCTHICLPLPGGRNACVCPDGVSSDQCRPSAV